MELIRMFTLYITGYDAPFLKSGILETQAASESMEAVLRPYLAVDAKNGKQLENQLQSAIHYLAAHPDFDCFDRMEYLTRYALPLQERLDRLIRRLGLEQNTSQLLNFNAANLFDRDYLKAFDGIPAEHRKELATLGKSLFYDQALSSNQEVSCSSCHQPEHYFSDGLVRSPSIKKDAVLKRHTPSLLYAGRQHRQFWDGRAKTLVDQVQDVLQNPLEMGISKKQLTKRIAKNKNYTQALGQLFPPAANADSLLQQVSLALAAYVADLSPMNAPFDRYIRGDKDAMTATQIKGFNLFTGKAQCGTCHFMPYFNALLPPLYDVSEIEVLGTPLNDDLEHPKADPDRGRYDLYQIRYYQQAFKTPTVRNTAKTAPYMHNGGFKTLESLIDFYNRGGGRGIGLQVEAQTLSTQALQLTQDEINQLIQFIQSLTDNPVNKNTTT